MNFLPIAIIAYLLNAVAVTIDKILLVKRLPNPALYVFYISTFSLIVFLGVPFTGFPTFGAFIAGSFSTILWTLGAYFMFKALKTGETARVIPIIGTLIPVILLFMSSVSGAINLNEVWAVIFLLLGLIFLIFPYLRGRFSKDEILLEVVSALFFANSYFLLKEAYNSSDFLSVMVYSRVILIPILLSILIFPFLRKKVFASSEHHPSANLWSKTGLILFIGQACGGASGLLLTFSISLANPAVINSIQGIQYIFLFVLGLALSKKYPAAFSDRSTKGNFFGKIAGIVLIFFGLWILSYGASAEDNPKLGLTFSPRYALELGLDPKEVYGKILDDLNPEIIRLPVYWDEVEKTPGEFDFSGTEEMVKMAGTGDSNVILTLGFKQPRWPECFQPEWAKNLSQQEFDQKVIELVQKEVETFKKYPNIKYWQVENEPFVAFGLCPKPDKERLSKEIQAVKSLDSRPVIITDSGELSSWFKTINLGDVFGTTLYRTVWSPYFGSVSYPWPPLFYNVKASILKYITGSKNQTLISELQGEPWPDDAKSIPEIDTIRQTQLFPVKNLSSNLNYAKQTRLGPVLFWGVEWWYYMKEEKGISDYWEKAKTILLH